MNNCLKKYKDMLHAYEVGILSDVEREEFEQHVLECSSCFEHIKMFRKEAEMLRDDSEIKDFLIDLHKPATTKTSKNTELQKILRWVAGVAAVITLLILSPWQLEFKSTDNIIATENKLMVIDFDNLSQTSNEKQYGKIIANLLITDLTNSQQIQIVSHQRVLDVKNQLGFNQLEPLDADQMMEVARFLNVRWVLTGTLLQMEPNYEVISQLIELPKGDVVSAQRVVSKKNVSIFELADTLTTLAKQDLSIPFDSLSTSKLNVADITTTSEEAYASYLNGVENFYRFYYQEALKDFEIAISYDSNFAMAYYYLSKLKDRNLIKKAILYSENINPKEKLYIKSRAASIIGNEDSAKTVLQSIVKMYPEEKDAYYQIGQIYYYQESMFDSAIVNMNLVIEMDPYFKPVYNLLVYCYTMVDDYENAIITMDRYLTLDSMSANPHDTKGDLNAEFGKLDKAIVSYKKALSIKPDFYSSLYQLGYMYLYQGNFKMADSCLQALSQADSKYMQSAARMYLTYLPIRKGQYNKARNDLQNHIMIEKNDSTLASGSAYKYFLDAILYEGLGEIENAIKTMDTVLIRSSQSKYSEAVDFVFYKIHLLALNNEYKIVETLIDSLSTIEKFTSKEFFTYWYGKGIIEYNKNNYSQASEYFLKSVSRALEKNAYGYYNGRYMAALSYYHDGDLPKALNLFENMKTVYTSRRLYWSVWDNKIPYYLGRIYEDSKWNKKAIDAYTQFILTLENADTEIPELKDATKRLDRLIIISKK